MTNPQSPRAVESSTGTPLSPATPLPPFSLPPQLRNWSGDEVSRHHALLLGHRGIPRPSMLIFFSPFLHFGHSRFRAGGWVCTGALGGGWGDGLMIWDRDTGPFANPCPHTQRTISPSSAMRGSPCPALPNPNRAGLYPRGAKEPRKGLEPGATSPEPALGRMQPRTPQKPLGLELFALTGGVVLLPTVTQQHLHAEGTLRTGTK